MAGPPNPSDDLEAVRVIADALKPFAPDDQHRILRWAQEKVGLTGLVAAGAAEPPLAPAASSTVAPVPSRRDIRSFLQEKRPASDVQFAAAVAYYFAFEATAVARKEEIVASDLQEAARLSGRTRLTNPIQTLHNAARLGYLDKGQARGTFRINTVGENLVAMAMPGGGRTDSAPQRAKNRRRGRKPKKQTARS